MSRDPMTAVDHAELKRVAERCTTGDPWYKDGDLRGRQSFGQFLPQDRAHITGLSPQVAVALLSEIEGLKAERDALEDVACTLRSVSCDLANAEPKWANHANDLMREALRLEDLRTQAPDSWRPDREAVMAIIDANKYEPWTVDRAGQMADAILAVRPQDEAMTAAFVPIDGQYFTSEQDWINRATRVLTGHAQYNNTEHGDASGWRGPHFTALSFDQAGRRVRNGADFKRATVEGTYPVWWIWPDQIVPALRPQTAESGK